jgi:aspartate 1-decarboxylase
VFGASSLTYVEPVFSGDLPTWLSFEPRKLFTADPATLPQVDVGSKGSVSADEELLEAADIREFLAVHVWNVTNGSRLMTYALKGPGGSRVVRINCAAAHPTKPGDKVIIATFAEVEEAELAGFKPTVGAAGRGQPRQRSSGRRGTGSAAGVG